MRKGGSEGARCKRQMQESEGWRAASGFKIGRKAREYVNGGGERERERKSGREVLILGHYYCKVL